MKNKIDRYIACMEERISAYTVFVEKPEGKRPHGRPRCRWEDNTKMDLQEIVCSMYGGEDKCIQGFGGKT